MSFSEIVQVMSAYESTGPEQLSIERGQLIHVYKKSSSGWWEGELQVCLCDSHFMYSIALEIGFLTSYVIALY